MPPLPTLRFDQLRFAPDQPRTAPAVAPFVTPFATPFATGSVTHFSRARYALRSAYARAGVGSNGSVLLPAYHCRTMVDGAVAIGGKIGFYAVQAGLAPDLNSLQRCLAQATVPVRAVVVAHFFGFAQPLDPIAEWCSAQRIDLIEDCSHVMTGPSGPAPDSPVGHRGACGVASPYKFFPVEDGGLLWSNPPRGEALPLPRRSRKDELKSLYRVWQAARAAARFDAVRPPGESSGRSPGLALCGRDVEERGSLLSENYDPREAQRPSLGVSRWLAGHADQGRIASARRARYRQWLEVLARLPGMHALYPDLPDGCVPYMVPVCLDRPEPVFHQLKRIGMPVWRWDEMAVSDCEVALAYRQRLIHLPCHQALDDRQMQWLTDTLSQVAIGCGAGVRVAAAG